MVDATAGPDPVSPSSDTSGAGERVPAGGSSALDLKPIPPPRSLSRSTFLSEARPPARSESPCSRRLRGGRHLATTGPGNSSPRAHRGLVAAGHQVTLFATADSITTAALHATAPCGWSEDAAIDAKVAECLHIASVFERAAEFDIIHNGFDFLPLTYSGLVSTPVVTTIHGFSSGRIVPVYERYDSTTTYVSISNADRHPNLRYAATIHHGIDIDQFGMHPSPGGHLLFFGRIHPDKGTAHAIEVARRCGRRLDIAGMIQDESYFRAEVAPHVDGEQVRYLGVVDASSARPGTRRGACAAASDRLRRAVRLQRH